MRVCLMDITRWCSGTIWQRILILCGEPLTARTIARTCLPTSAPSPPLRQTGLAVLSLVVASPELLRRAPAMVFRYGKDGKAGDGPSFPLLGGLGFVIGQPWAAVNA